MTELTTVRFYGHLRKRFGPSHRLAVKNPAEAVRALCVVVPGFKRYMLQNSVPGYRVLAGKADVGPKELRYPNGRDDIRIVPAVVGAGGAFKVILGAALIAASVYFPGFGAIAGTSFSVSSVAASVGASMVLGGVSEMISGTPDAPQPAEQPNNQPSFAFNGPINTTAQGNPVPLAYGTRIRVGSQVISAGLSVSQLAG